VGVLGMIGVVGECWEGGFGVGVGGDVVLGWGCCVCGWFVWWCVVLLFVGGVVLCFWWVVCFGCFLLVFVGVCFCWVWGGFFVLVVWLVEGWGGLAGERWGVVGMCEEDLFFGWWV